MLLLPPSACRLGSAAPALQEDREAYPAAAHARTRHQVSSAQVPRGAEGPRKEGRLAQDDACRGRKDIHNLSEGEKAFGLAGGKVSGEDLLNICDAEEFCRDLKVTPFVARKVPALRDECAR